MPMDILLMRLRAPMMSFGAPIVDSLGVIQPYPALSMVCGLLGNALGYHHRDADKLTRLQGRLRFAVRQDLAGRRLRDFQTADLGQDFMLSNRAWTTSGVLDERAGGSAKTGTHIRKRDYWVDAAYTLAVGLEGEGEPSLEALDGALRYPARPLFIGRKPCVPSERISMGLTQADSLVHALRRAPLAKNAPRRVAMGSWMRARLGSDDQRCAMWWPQGDPNGEDPLDTFPVTDARDWANQIHVGQRWLCHGQVPIDTLCAEASTP